METITQTTAVPEIEAIREPEFEGVVADETTSPWEWLRYLHLLREKRRILSKTAIWALVLSTIIAFVIPKRYGSTTTIMPPDSLGGTNGMMMAALAGKASPGLAAMAGSMLGMKSTGALFSDLLRSRTVEEDIVDRFQLQQVYWVRYKQDARKILNERTSISEDRKSGVITIVVTDRDPRRSRDMAQAYVDELNKLVSRVSTSSARRERVFIEQRMISVKADLEDAEKQFSAFASKNTALDITAQAKAMVEAGATLQGQLIAAQAEFQGLQQIYTDGNVRVRSARARIDELKRQLQKMGGTDASVASSTPQPGELYPPIRKLPLLGVEWADLYRRVKIQETVYELLNQQYELARIEEAKEIPTVNVIDPANFPEKKSWPPRLVIIFVLTFAALGLAGVQVIAAERMQDLDQRDPRRQLATAASGVLTQVTARFGRSGFFRRNSDNSGNRNGRGA